MNEKINKIGSDTITLSTDLSKRTLNERIIEKNTIDKTPSPNTFWEMLLKRGCQRPPPCDLKKIIYTFFDH